MTHLCHICLLPIPDAIASPTHPLSKTKDHVVPKCAGGTSDKVNIAPAHYYCNRRKGNGAVTHQLMLHCFGEIGKELKRMGIVPKKPEPVQFDHLHAMIRYLCGELDRMEDEMEELYRERGFAR